MIKIVIKVEEIVDIRRIWYSGGYYGPNIMDFEGGEWSGYEKDGARWYRAGTCEVSVFLTLLPTAIKLGVDLSKFNVRYVTVRHLVESIANKVGSFKERGETEYKEDITVDIYRKNNGDLIYLKSSMDIGECCTRSFEALLNYKKYIKHQLG